MTDAMSASRWGAGRLPLLSIDLADALIADGWTRVPPAPPPVLEVTELADAAFREGCDSVRGGGVWDHSPLSLKIRAAGLRAAWPHLTRSCADGLTDEECEAIAAEIGMTDGSGLIRTILRRVAARREA